MDLPWRIAYLEREDGIKISTIKVPYLKWHGEYETAISIDDSYWIIYRGYDSDEEAIKAHEELSKMTKEEILSLSDLVSLKD